MHNFICNWNTQLETWFNGHIYLLAGDSWKSNASSLHHWLRWRGSWYALIRDEIEVYMKEIELKKSQIKILHTLILSSSLFVFWQFRFSHQNVYIWNMYVQGAISIIDTWYPVYLTTFYCAFVQAILYMNSWPFISVYSSWTLFSSNFV